MLFNSLPFLFVFLPVSILGYQIAGLFGRRAVLLWLSAVSIYFYAAWNRGFVVLLLTSVLANFGLGRLITSFPAQSATRRRWLLLGVLLNLLTLFYYKYLFHVIVALARLLPAADLQAWGQHPIVLPLGISFFTFTQIAYLIDLAQEQARKEDFLGYLLFVTFFPHLIAGPLLHHKEIMPQFEEPLQPVPRQERRFQVRSPDFASGLTLFVMGLAKKVLIADKLAPAADAAFANGAALGALDAWSGLLIYCMQLYFDFSGYSDMAIGVARIFGIRFPWNFDSPWKATSVTEYWQRWHMTLTRYVTLYLYNPLLLAIQRRRLRRGKKISRKALHTPTGFAEMIFCPLMTAMLLTGIWHGAGLKFVIFGSLHGLYLTAHQVWKHFGSESTAANEKTPAATSPGRVVLMRLGMLLQVAFALIFFRAASLHAAGTMLAAMLGRHGGLGTITWPLTSVAMVALFAVVWYLPNTQQILGEGPVDLPTTRLKLLWRADIPWAIALGMLFFASLVSLDGASAFLYFQF